MNPILLNQLRTQYRSIRRLTGHIPGPMLEKEPLPGKWSIKDHVAHLGSYQMVFTERLYSILTGNCPHFDRYVADTDPLFQKWRLKTYDDILTELDSGRLILNNRISQLNDNEIVLTGNHPRFGLMNVSGWIDFFLWHEAHHIFSVFQLVHRHD